MNVDGTCLCGQIQFEADIDPKTTTICHCTDCQINSGTAFGYVVEGFEVLEELSKDDTIISIDVLDGIDKEGASNPSDRLGRNLVWIGSNLSKQTRHLKHSLDELDEKCLEN